MGNVSRVSIGGVGSCKVFKVEVDNKVFGM